MASPQSGTTVTVDVPESPIKAIDADVADPGMAAEAMGAEPETEEVNSEESDTTQEESEESHWVGIELKDEEGNPIPNEAYEIKLPDGKILSGRLDKEGKARVERLEKGGKCDVSFPRIHEEEISKQ